MNVVDSNVNAVTTAKVDITKKENSIPSTWQENMCFELEVPSPYRDPNVYTPFKADAPPVCTPTTSGIEMTCRLKENSLDTLQFVFTKVDASVAGFTALRFEYTNFHTPFSAQTFS